MNELEGGNSQLTDFALQFTDFHLNIDNSCPTFDV
jgi:hypothetical protein